MQNVDPLKALTKPHLPGDTSNKMQGILNNALSMNTTINKIVNRSHKLSGMLHNNLQRAVD
ncbi:hypothetical protein Plhal304r1_c101g0174931 [Plasmopara halstedii]